MQPVKVGIGRPCDHTADAGAQSVSASCVHTSLCHSLGKFKGNICLRSYCQLSPAVPAGATPEDRRPWRFWSKASSLECFSRHGLLVKVREEYYLAMFHEGLYLKRYPTRSFLRLA